MFASYIGVRKIIVILTLVLTVTAPLHAQSWLTVTDQKMAVPSYFYPGPYWTQLEDGAPTVGLAIINPNNGPGRQFDQNYADEVQRAKDKGIWVIGYVFTSYGERPLARVKKDIDKYYRWYGVDGIFLDEAANTCSKQRYYKRIYTYVKTKGGLAKVVINPGINTEECYITAADIIVNFENDYDAYINWQPSGWEYNYPADRFWHLVINTSDTDMPIAVDLSKNNHAGWIYITPDTLPNPWDTLPIDPYWTDELTLIGQ